jgi:hypothetical protein
MLTLSCIVLTNAIKPASQFFSHVVQLHETWNKRSTEGVSLLSQHLNMLGGLLGIVMYSYIPPKSFFTYMVYYNSIFQALSLYALAVYFDGWEPLILRSTTSKQKDEKEESEEESEDSNSV